MPKARKAARSSGGPFVLTLDAGAQSYGIKGPPPPPPVKKDILLTLKIAGLTLAARIPADERQPVKVSVKGRALDCGRAAASAPRKPAARTRKTSKKATASLSVAGIKGPPPPPVDS